MTDHNREEREALIEKAARAILARSWGLGTMDSARADAEIAFGVFEQAHTPTSDERDRCNVSWAASPEWGDRKHECDLDRGHSGDHACGWCIACEFSASTHPEPIQAAIERVLDEAGYSVLDEWRADVVHLIAEWAAGFRRTVQDEPAAALRRYLRTKGFNPSRIGNWDTSSGIGLAREAFLTGWHAAFKAGGEGR